MPTQYLGGKIYQVTFGNGTKCWSFISSKYIQNDVNNVEYYLHTKEEKIPACSNPPLSSNYRPETDVSPDLLTNNATYFQSLIGFLQCIVELGRADITMEISAQPYMMESPSFVFGCNQSILSNISLPHLTTKNKSSSIIL